MPEHEFEFPLAGETMVALADRALFWPRHRMLLVADVHFGKDAAFRHALRWVPPGTTADDLARLTTLIERHRVEQLVILGDAFHSEHAGERVTLDELRDWRVRLPTRVLMVKGNHDRRAAEIARALDFEVADENCAMPPFLFRHKPRVRLADGYILCGHVHPVVLARGLARQRIRVRCFWVQPHQCILPSFGGFTGGYLVRPAIGDRILLVAGGRVIARNPRGTMASEPDEGPEAREKA
jgi:DNA ligase-associated metallophosphoesterase